MATQNIQIGIDLGTTNSEIAVNNKGSIEIIKNRFGDDYTPSVFGIDKSKNPMVGKRAYERLFKDASESEVKNYKAEIKRLMGTVETVFIERLSKDMSAEEISAEILKSLKEDLMRKYPDMDTSAAVITIPAYFSTLQAEATKRAGNLAGFDHVVLLQEPIAAAVAYGFNNNSEDENWLVYDLGGGTFDVALISCKGGTLSDIAHNGDNFLGGKDFDKLIIQKIIKPKILEKFKIKAFAGDDPKSPFYSKLKYYAELAKIELSSYAQTTIQIDGMGNDDEGNEIYISINFTRVEFEALIKPQIDRTIELSKQTIKESGLKITSVKKIIFVGGPTQIPYIRQRLEQEFKIAVDTSVDPLTVVARGACIFAASQQIERKQSQETKVDGALPVTLHFASLTAETEETISGIIDSLKDTEEDYYVQLQSESGFYSSSKIKLKKGKFFDNIALEQKKINQFWLYLFDGKGNPVATYPDSFSITHGLSISGAPIPHSIGVALAKKDLKSNFSLTEIFEPIFEKGSVLPLKSEPRIYKTAKKLKKSENNDLLIKIYEGESDIPDRNTYVCDVKINGSSLPYDLPEGTEVQLSLEVSESREIKVDVFIPTIDLWLSARGSVHAENIDPKKVAEELRLEKQRFEEMNANCTPAEKAKLSNMIESVDTSLRSAHLDEDEKRKAGKQLKDLKIGLDQLKKEKEMPQLVSDFHSQVSEVQSTISDFADLMEKEKFNQQLNVLKSEGERAIASSDKYLLNRVNQQIGELERRAMLSNPATWAHYFNQITSGNHKFTNADEALYYTNKGRKAIEIGDVDELKRCVRNLISLLPEDEQNQVRGNISGITH